MTRSAALRQLEDRSTVWDVAVVGGGATGLGCAVDAASRGYRTLLLEKSDFAKATSSRSTKLIHGGVRYLKQGNIPLVRESLHERGLLIRNAPHLVRPLSFVVPCYSGWERIFYGIGLKTYDWLAGRSNLSASKRLSKSETLQRLPTLAPQGLKGGVEYFDAQFDDARLAVSLAQTVHDLHGVVLNYCGVIGLHKEGGRITGLEARDEETGEVYSVKARAVINATGIFTDRLRQWDEPTSRPIMTVSQGAHLVLPHSFLPGDTAIMIPKTKDGRVLFAIPWHDRTLLGTTDTPVSEAAWEPRPLPQEIEFLLSHASQYLRCPPKSDEVLSVFAGLRPLVASGGDRPTSKISRDHTILVSESGLVTVTGGKWTTYRRMAEDAVDRASVVGGLERRPCVTQTQTLHGAGDAAGPSVPWSSYGADEEALETTVREHPTWSESVHPDLPYRRGEVVWAVRREMARTVEDFLSRRSRALLLDARAAQESAPVVARLMAQVMGHSSSWESDQVAAFQKLADGYLPPRKGL